MNISILETEHFEGAYPVIRLFDVPGNEITIYTNERSYHQFQFLFPDDLERYRWVIGKTNEPKYRMLQRIYTDSRAHIPDILYLNTVSSNFIFYALLIRLLKKVRVVLTLHDINTHFRFINTFSIRRLVRNFGKKHLVNAVNEFNVVSLTMVPYLQQLLPSHKKVHCIPGAVFEESRYRDAAPGISAGINIVVPGSIDKRRRDYNIVFDLLDQAGRSGLPVNITLLGGYYNDYGIRILERCRAYALTAGNLSYYDAQVVDQPEFDRVMNAAHFVWIPSVIDTVISDDIPETYGLSKSSGNLFDIIKHAKPFIVPVSLNVDTYLENSCLRYGNVAEILLRLSETDLLQYDLLKRNALDASRNYTPDAVRNRNKRLFVA